MILSSENEQFTVYMICEDKIDVRIRISMGIRWIELAPIGSFGTRSFNHSGSVATESVN